MKNATPVKRKPSSLDSDAPTTKKVVNSPHVVVVETVYETALQRCNPGLSPLSPSLFDHRESRPLVDGTSETITFPNTTMDHTKTKSETIREKTLLEDPLASLLDPYQVLCKQCGGTIQLSKKAAYDLFHWKNHKKRCNRKLKTIKGKKPKAKALRNATHGPPASPLGNVTLRTVASSSPLFADRSPRTPPLVYDSDEDPDQRSERSWEVHSPAMPSQHIPATSPPPISHLTLDPVETYMSRSHRGYVHRSPGLPTETWKNWSWAQLKEPQFAVGGHKPDREDLDLEIEEDERSERSSHFLEGIVDEKAHEAACTLLSMLSQTR